MRKIWLAGGVFLLILGLLMVTNCFNKPAADLAIVNARIWTGNPAQPWVEALTVKAEKIIGVGDYAQVKSQITSRTRVLDLGGRFACPGFIDAHVHFIEGGFHLTQVQLRDARTKAVFIARIKAFAAKCAPGEWITGGDWDHSLWGGTLPERDWIDAVTPHNPVWISRLDGHMALANSLALQAAGIDRHTPAVEGGTIVRDRTGEPTGILKDNALYLVEKVIPQPTMSQKSNALMAAMRYVAQQGVTAVHHMGGWDDLAVFEQTRKAGQLITRISAAVPLGTWEDLTKKIKREGRGDHWLRYGTVKGFVDGSLGSHTAAFFEPYCDTGQDSGLLVNTPADLYALISASDKAGLQVAIHAIGDRANRLLLDIYERVSTENGGKDRRFRIEHAQHLSPADIPRFAALGVIASMQPYHCIDDGRWAERFIGHQRCMTTYAFRSLLDRHARLVFGSDWYVAPPTPLEGIYAALTRRTLDNKNPGGWIPDQKISLPEALQAYTLDAAYASFEEKLQGSLEIGKLADLVVLNRNLFQISPETINQVLVDMTIVGGQLVYQRPD